MKMERRKNTIFLIRQTNLFLSSCASIDYTNDIDLSQGRNKKEKKLLMIFGSKDTLDI